MGIMDWILIAIIAAYFGYVLFFRKQKGCCGDCSQCSSCYRKHEKTPH